MPPKYDPFSKDTKLLLSSKCLKSRIPNLKRLIILHVIIYQNFYLRSKILWEADFKVPRHYSTLIQRHFLLNLLQTCHL